jgi:hypothetical protein
MAGRIDDRELSLFADGAALRDDDRTAPVVDPVQDPLEVIDDDLDAWERLCRLASLDSHESDRLRSLGRDLKALRDCFRATGHPRVQQALLREAESVSRRMRSQARRLRIPGAAIRVVPSATDGRARARA